MEDDQSNEPPNNPVAWHRFVKVNEAKAALEARVAELEAETQRWQEKAATADTLAQQVEQWQTRAKEATRGLSEYQAAARIGVTDPELYEAARWAHSRLPEQDRPSFADALEAWKGDPSAAPLVLRPHLQPPAAAQPAATPATPPNPAPPPNTGAEAYQEAPEPLDPATMTLEQYRQHRDRFKGASLI